MTYYLQEGVEEMKNKNSHSGDTIMNHFDQVFDKLITSSRKPELRKWKFTFRYRGGYSYINIKALTYKKAEKALFTVLPRVSIVGTPKEIL